jgi:phosphopantothenoylcysteine decarboxylase/phosphopantothenate--cysteine ligase
VNCIITAGPTFEPVDQVRRLTNFSTGRLGTELAGYLAGRGHKATLLLGEMATVRQRPEVARLEMFSTTETLRSLLYSMASPDVNAVFHVAAISDFAPGKLWQKQSSGALQELRAGKVSSRLGTLLLELVPTVKIIASLREWYPAACLVGWKYEVDGDRASVLAKATQQNKDCRLNATVANGPSYGEGYGLLSSNGELKHVDNLIGLFGALESLVTARSS